MSGRVRKGIFSGVDKKTLATVEEEFEVLKTLSLDQGFAVLFLKQDQNSESPLSKGNSIFHVLEELNYNEQRGDSIESLDTVQVSNEGDDSDWTPVRGQRKGVALSSRRDANRRLKKRAGPSLGRVVSSSLRRNIGRSASKSPGMFGKSKYGKKRR
jgi:hypothetical protein